MEHDIGSRSAYGYYQVEVQLFRVFGSPDEQPRRGYALGDLSDPVNEYHPIGGHIFNSPDEAIAHASQIGWRLVRIEA